MKFVLSLLLAGCFSPMIAAGQKNIGHNIQIDSALAKVDRIKYQYPSNAIAICDSLLELYNGDSLITHYKVDAASSIEDTKSKVETLVSCARNEKNPEILSFIISSIWFANDAVYPLQVYRIATDLIKYSPKSENYRLRGEISADLKNYHDAQQDYAKALELANYEQRSWIFENIADCYMKSGQWFEAIQYFNKVENTSYMPRMIIFNRGFCKLKLLDYRGAKLDFDLSINLAKTLGDGMPSIQEVVFQKAKAKIGLKDYVNAANDLVSVLKAVTDDSSNDQFRADVYHTLGNVRHILKQKDAACYNWSKAGALGSRTAYDNIKLFCK